jgi:hypothetical protein
MAAPTFHSIGTQLQGTVSTASLAKPGTMSDGDVVLALVFINSTTTVSSAPSGFTQASGSPIAVASGGGAHSMVAYWKRVTTASGEPSTYDFVLSGSQYVNGCAAAYSGCVASGTPLDVTNSAHFDTNATATPNVAVTTSTANTLLVFQGGNWSGGAWTPPTSFTERVDTGDRVHTIDDLAQAAAGSSGNVSATNASSAPCTAWLGALLPVASGTTQNAAATISITDTVTSAATMTKPADTAVTVTDTVASAAAVTRPADAAVAITNTVASAGAATRPADAVLLTTDVITTASTVTRPADATSLAVTSTVATAAAVALGGATSVSVTTAIASAATVTRAAIAAVSVANVITTAASGGTTARGTDARVFASTPPGRATSSSGSGRITASNEGRRM